MFGSKRHAELIEKIDGLNGRVNELEYWLTEALRALASKEEVSAAVKTLVDNAENNLLRLDAFRLDEHERVHGILKAQADRLELNAIRSTPGNRTAPGRG